MSHRGAVIPQSASHDCGGHGRSPGSHCVPGVQYVRISTLYQARKQSRVGFARLRLAKTCQQTLDGGTRGDFAVLVPAYSIGEGEQPAARASFLRGRRKNVSEVILVSLAYFSEIRNLRKLNIHGDRDRTVFRGIARDVSRNLRLKASVH